MSMPGREEEFGQSLSVLEEALAAGIRDFARWYASNWTMSREEWKHDFANPAPEGDWFEGHNAAVGGILTACDHYLDEFHP